MEHGRRFKNNNVIQYIQYMLILWLTHRLQGRLEIVKHRPSLVSIYIDRQIVLRTLLSSLVLLNTKVVFHPKIFSVKTESSRLQINFISFSFLFSFLFKLLSFLFLELGLEQLDYMVTHQSYQMTWSQVMRHIEGHRRFQKDDIIQQM